MVLYYSSNRKLMSSHFLATMDRHLTLSKIIYGGPTTNPTQFPRYWNINQIKVTCSHKWWAMELCGHKELEMAATFQLRACCLASRELFCKRSRRMEQMFRRKQSDKENTTFGFPWLHLSNNFLFTWFNLIRILFFHMQWCITETEELRMDDYDSCFYVSTSQDHRIIRHLVEYRSECICEGVSGED